MPTHAKVPENQVSALNAFIPFMRAHGLLQAALTPLFLEHGLSAPQFGILETLYHLGPLCPSALGAKLLSSKANVSELLQNMERAGWIQRTPSAEDQRSHLLHLTPKGLEAVREAFPDFSRRLADLFEGISPEDRENLRRICRALGTGLEARSPKERPTNARAAKGGASTKE